MGQKTQTRSQKSDQVRPEKKRSQMLGQVQQQNNSPETCQKSGQVEPENLAGRSKKSGKGWPENSPETQSDIQPPGMDQSSQKAIARNLARKFTRNVARNLARFGHNPHQKRSQKQVGPENSLEFQPETQPGIWRRFARSNHHDHHGERSGKTWK